MQSGGYKFVENDHLIYRYQLLRILGAGVFGEVFEAVDHKTHERVAIKALRMQYK